MLTPQEVSARAFHKASFGGYNMTMVDEFLDQITTDYSALYKENALLKTKMKALTDSIDEYRTTETAMRKALLAAQQMADEMIREAEARKAALIQQAETEAAARMAEITNSVEEEEKKLVAAKEATATYISRLRALFSRYQGFIDSLEALVPQEESELGEFGDVASTPDEETTSLPDTETFKRYSILLPKTEEKKQEGAEASAASKNEPSDFDATRRLDRFADLKFGKDYEIG